MPLNSRAVTPASISISRASADDAVAILALQLRAYQSEAHLYQDWTIPPLTQTLAALVDEIQDTTVLKAEDDGTLVGSVRAVLAGGVCHIGRLIVEPARQGRGIGTALLEAIERSFPGASQFELFTGSRSEANIRLYVRQGYTVTGTRKLSDEISLVLLRKACGSSA